MKSSQLHDDDVATVQLFGSLILMQLSNHLIKSGKLNWAQSGLGGSGPGKFVISQRIKDMR